MSRLLPRRRTTSATAADRRDGRDRTDAPEPGAAVVYVDETEADPVAGDPPGDGPGRRDDRRRRTEPAADGAIDSPADVPMTWFDRVRAAGAAVAASRVPLVGLALLLLAGLVGLGAALAEIGPVWAGEVGAVLVSTGYTWALAARVGGRPVVFGTVAAALGALTLVADADFLRTGAAVLTAAVASVLAVMVTVPAQTVWRAAREALIAVVVAAVGALAVVGLEPTVEVTAFEYVTLGLALAGALALVHRLGAGFHGLGRRGVVIVAIGGVLLVGILVYAEVLRRYGEFPPTRVLLDVVDFSRDNLGASPRPLEAVLGVPALAYGCHIRARRRQGWWVCAFGVAGTTAVANSLVPPGVPFLEVSLSVVYGLVVGLVLAWLVIRLDAALTGGTPRRRGTRAKGRRSRVGESRATAVRPEPARTRPLM